MHNVFLVIIIIVLIHGLDRITNRLDTLIAAIEKERLTDKEIPR